VVERYPVVAGVTLSADELEFSYVRAQGAGGQHVNKTSTAAVLRFDSQQSSLPDWAKQRLLNYADDRITREGVVQIKAQSSRSQEQNKLDAINRLVTLLQKALFVEKARRATRPTLASKVRRLDGKKAQQQRKQQRGKVRLQEG